MQAITYNPGILQYVFDNAKVGIAICNAKDNRLEMVNPAFAAIHGYEQSELIGAMPSEVFAPECMIRLTEHENNSAMCATHDVSFETKHIKKDGSFVNVSIHITIIKDDNGEIIQRIANIIDISERKDMEEVISSKERRLRSLTENIPDNIARFDKEGNYIYLNPAHEKTLGVKEEEVLGKSIKVLFPHHTEAIEAIEKIQRLESDSVTVRQIVPTLDGTREVHEVKIIAEKNEQGELLSILGIGRDITEIVSMHEQLTQAVELRRGIINSIPDFLFEVDRAGNYLNFWFHDKKIMDTYRNRLIGKNIKDVLPHQAVDIALEALEEADNNKISSGKIYSLEEHNIIRWFELSISKKSDGNFLALARDVTERTNIEKRIEFMAHHDALTGLPNRILLKERGEKLLLQSKKDSQQVALLFIDLDGFKTINDSLGHTVGDSVLKKVAQRLLNSIRIGDTLSRHGGDEFIALLPNITDISEVVTIANKVLNKFKKSLTIDNHILSTSASIGIAVYPEHGATFEQLLQNADAAMYKAKENGKNNYCFFTQKMKHNLVGLFKMQNNLKNAIKNKEFVLHYQPQVDLVKNKIVGVEALIRWQHPSMGMVPPLHFIPTAENTGLIVPIGEWVIHEACRQGAIWNQEGKDIVVAVNVSAVQFKRGNLLDVVKNALAVSKLHPKYLELELTESILINDTENVLETVKGIKELGIQLSIDDFGTGYSSLAYLKRFAVDKLKIDQSFVRDIINDKEDASIVKTIIQMAKSFNLKSIAEGVENGEVLKVLEEFGCDEVQGYHFAKPMVVEEFSNYYENMFS
jgi:diguanylate cyclase (GGDEF)-like protein/PAS domain S-box-containing protein